MKKSILATVLLIGFLTSAFATGESKISYFILNSFNRDFKDAKNVVWTSKTGLAEARFTLNDRKTEVFYNANGSIYAISKSIELDELPVNAKRAFAKRYEGYIVKEAIQYEGTDEESYYISAENEKESVIIKVEQQGELSIFKKTKK